MSRPTGLEFKTLAVVNPVEPDSRGVIEALVAVTGVKDEVGDIIEPGAFRRTLGERPKPKVCLGHDWNRPIGRSLDVVELMPGDTRLPRQTADGRPWPREAGALKARWLANLNSEDGKSAYSNAKFFGPEESTFSIGYRTVRARQRGGTRHIHDLDLFEYGPVLNPANRLATLQSIKSDEVLTNPIDSERQDFETGDGAVETKTKYVRDANYWGKPLGTPITPGMKPRGGHDRAHGTSDTPQRASSFFASLPDSDQAYARSLTADQREKYLDARIAGKDHDEAARAAKPAAVSPKPADDDKPTPADRRIPSPPQGDADKPATSRAPQKKTPTKPTAKQKALLFSAAPGRIMTYRRDENGEKIFGGPSPNKEGLIFRGHANSAYPMERAGWVEAGYDGRHYILTPQGERLRAQLESEDADRQTQLGEEQRAAALGPESAAPADANVDADAASMNMTPRQYADGILAAQARRNRARNIADEQEKVREDDSLRIAADQAALMAPGAIDLDALKKIRATTGQQIERRANIELAGNGRVALVGAGNKNWGIVTADNRAVVRAFDFEGGTGKPPGKRQLRDLANRITGIRDSAGRAVPFDFPGDPNNAFAPDWVSGWRDAHGADLQSAITSVLDQWARDNGLTYRRRSRPSRPTPITPGGEPDAGGFRMRKAEELAPGDQVRLPDGSVGTIERSGADVWQDDREAKKIQGQVLLTDGRTIPIRELAGLPEREPQASDAQYGSGPAARDMVVPVKFVTDADSADAGHNPGMGSLPAAASPPGREYTPGQFVGSTYVPALAKTYEPLPAGTRVAQNEMSQDSHLPHDIRAKVGTALPLITEFSGETFQTVRLDDGTYDQWRVRGVRGSLGNEGAFEIDPSPERVDEIRRQRGLSPIAESTPLNRAQPEPVEAVAPAVEPPPAPVAEPKPARPPKVVATDLPEREALPYEVIKKPNRSGKGARVRFNGREYGVDATSGVIANVTVTDDDGHTATVDGGSSTLLRRDQFADRERALRQALNQVEAQHVGEADNAQGEAIVGGGSDREADVSPAIPAPGVLTSREAVLVALDQTAAASIPSVGGRFEGQSESATQIAEAVRSGNRKIATSPAAPPGLFALSPPAHMSKGGYPWQIQTSSGVRVPTDALFARSLDRFSPKSGKRSSLLLEAFGETVRDADGNPPPWGDVDISWTKTWRDAHGLSAGDAAIRLALPAYLRKLGANKEADEFERDLPEPPGAQTGPRRGFQKDPADVRPGDRIYGDDNDEVTVEAVEPSGNYFDMVFTNRYGRQARKHFHRNMRVWIIEEGGPAVEPETPQAPEPEVSPETEPELATIPVDQVDEAAALQDEVLGIVEQPDGTIEVTEEVAARQDRVAALIEQDDAGTLDLSSKAEPELTSTRGELSEELKLQSLLATRSATPKPETVKNPDGEPQKPPQRPGLAGAAEDYSEALQSGDAEAVARTRARLESSLRRSRAGSESARALADHITGEGDDDAEALTDFAARMRREQRERRNTAARRRRTARRLERVRIQSLIDKIDSELQNRARAIEPEESAARQEPRDAASIREEIARLEQEMNRVAGVDANEDNAIVNLSPNSRSRAARNAGRRRFASMDRDLARFTELRQRRDNLQGSLANAEARERRVERETKPTINKADLANAEMIRDSRDGGWKKVRRVNATTVTVEPQFAGLDAPKIPHSRIIGVLTSTDAAERADTLAANYEETHGTAGVREAVDRLRARKSLSAGDQALLAALEARLTSRDDSANVASMSDANAAPRPKANADRPRPAAPTRVTHQPGDRVQSEYGRGTVLEQTGRGLRYRLDSGEELSVAVGTPGYDRVRPISEADTLAANYEEMHGIAGVRAMVERLRNSNRALSQRDQALLFALEDLLGKAAAGTTPA